jgi:hypothetical protein
MKAVDNGLKCGQYQVIVEDVYLIPKSYDGRGYAVKQAEVDVLADIDFIIEYVEDSVEYYTDRIQESDYPDSAYADWRKLLSANKKALKKLKTYESNIRQSA